MRADGRGVRDGMRLLAGAAAMASAAIGFTALGAGLALGRGLFGLVSHLCPLGTGRPEPRHHAGRVREQARVARQAARAAGILRP